MGKMGNSIPIPNIDLCVVHNDFQSGLSDKHHYKEMRNKDVVYKATESSTRWEVIYFAST